jgi:DNA-binding IclR family transcriptional regulator
MSELAGYAPDGTTVVLCRAFRDSVICVHQVLGRGPQPLVSYERGRPMPLFRGATSTAILAWLNNRQLKRIYQEHAKKIAAAKLGTDWQSFRANMAAIRKAGFVVAWHQVDSGRAGIAAPILDSGGKVLGSLSYIVLEAAVDEARVMRLASLIVGAARETEKLLLQAASPVKQRKKTPAAAR